MSASPKPPSSTAANTEPRQGRSAWPENDEPVVGLRSVVGDGQEPVEDIHPLPRIPRFTLGRSSACTVQLNDPSVSRQHCQFDRHGDELWVTDVESRDGTYINGVPIKTGQLKNGSFLRVGDMTFVAYSEGDKPRRQRDEIVPSRLVGEHPRFVAAVEEAMESTFHGRGAILCAEQGAGRTTIAQAIYNVHAGTRPDRLFHKLKANEPSFQVPVRADLLIKHAHGGVLYVHEVAFLSKSKLDQLARILRRASDELALRVVVSTARPIPLHELTGVPMIAVPALRERGKDLQLLIDHFARQCAPGWSAAAMPQSVWNALLAYDWEEGNVHELWDTIERLAAIVRCGTVYHAAIALRISRGTLQEWMNRRDIPYQDLVRS